MLKNSFLIVLIQATGIIFAMLSVYFVAGDMGPEIYSLRGIQAIVAGIILTFSHLGVETTMMREALYWKEQGEEEKVKEYATQSILSRLLGFLLLAPFVIIYLMFINFSKYDGVYTWLFILFFIGACISALNDSMSLIVRSEGGYVFSQFVKTLNADVISGLAILVYIKWGAQVYLTFFALSSIPVLFIFGFRLKQIFSFKYLKLRPTITKIRESKFLWMRSYLDYFKGSADSLLISVFFPPAIIGTYTIYKTLENMAKSFIEGFFDVLSQRAVKFKGQMEKLVAEERKYNYVRLAVITLVVLAGFFFALSPDFYINLANLSKYENMAMIVYAVLLVSIIYLLGKYEINFVSLFASSKTTFYIGIAGFILTIISYMSLIILPSIEGALLQRLISWTGASVISIFVFRLHRIEYYTHINK